jgi:small subunit ribosomal protein S18
MPIKQKKVCPIDAAGIKYIDYKDTTLLKKYLTKFNRIVPRYYSGVSLSNQKKLATAIKRARYMALLPYVLDVSRPTGQTLATTDAPPAPVSSTLDESAIAV